MPPSVTLVLLILGQLNTTKAFSMLSWRSDLHQVEFTVDEGAGADR
jgi:hypothetical protein